MHVKMLRAPAFTDEEQAQLVTDLLALKKQQIQGFLKRNDLRRAGTKSELREHVEEALRTGDLSLALIVQFLDEVTPWGKQHVFLYKGPIGSIEEWKSTDWVANLLKNNRLRKYLNASLPLALPASMKVSSISHDGKQLRITAIKKREWWERDVEYDEFSATDEGDPIALRAFVHRVTRSVVAFEWDLIANVAFLQISQLPARLRYEEVAKEFFNLIHGWFDVTRFSLVDLRPVIRKLQEVEDAKTGELRSHGAKYRTFQGRTLEARSASPDDSLLGEPVIDAAMIGVRKDGVGHLGNFYWLPGATDVSPADPLEANMHVIVVGLHNRINFPTPNGEPATRYVLSRIRRHCS